MSAYSRFQPFSSVDIPDDEWEANAARWRAAQDRYDSEGSPRSELDFGIGHPGSTELSDALSPQVWMQLRNRLASQLCGSEDQAGLTPMTVGSAGPNDVSKVTVVGRNPQLTKPPQTVPLTGRPGLAAGVAGALNTIASGPNTRAEVRGGTVDGVVTRGEGRDIHATGRVRIFGRLMSPPVGATGTLDPPAGRAEISASDIKGHGIDLPSRARIYTTPTGELDAEIPGPIRVGPITVPKGTYVIGQPDPPKKK